MIIGAIKFHIANRYLVPSSCVAPMSREVQFARASESIFNACVVWLGHTSEMQDIELLG